MQRHRRLLLGAAALVAAPALASSRRILAPMTDGPFYPTRAWRDGGPLAGDWDADLTRTTRGARTLVARGEHLGLQCVVVDARGRIVDGAEVEIWQCDTLAHYSHPRVTREPGAFDEGFQGFGSGRSARDGAVAFRTIRPVPYPGRTPHIHVKLRHPGFGEYTSQLFVAGDPGNADDFLWRRVPAEDRAALEMKLERVPASSGLAWVCRHELVMPA
jgi:protocatechuate 3,4-dioxygenase beta subunit